MGGSMASVDFRGLEKSFGSLRIVKGIDLAIADGEFIVLVGPSGCGKSTMLRMLAGLEGISGGEIRIGERRVNDLPPRERDVAMVFQDYALYPHKSVYENMAFSLRVRSVPADDIRRRVTQTAEMLGIKQLLERKPSQLSGGQRQRVAMGRAIVRRPSVFLFDEPLSNLDAKLRSEVRGEIKRLHQAIGTTIIYVTHDQVEAMTLADRIVILKGGAVEQIGTPAEVYNTPASIFVAGFIGSPAMNFVKASIGGDMIVLDGGARLPLGEARARAHRHDGQSVVVGIRPEHFSAAGEGSPVSGTVQVVEPLGSDTLIQFAIGEATVTARVPPETRAAPGELLTLGLDPNKIRIFDAISEQALN
jgi:multiple sugar transport system ATP-binding protein